MENTLVFDIGGTNVKYGIIDQNLEFLCIHEIPTEAQQGAIRISI